MRNIVPTFVALIATVAALSAQQIIVPPKAAAGDSIDVTVNDPANSGRVVKVEIDNGDPTSPDTVTVEVQLDDTGSGSVPWSVPEDWDVCRFNGDGYRQVRMSVTFGSGRGSPGRRSSAYPMLELAEPETN